MSLQCENRDEDGDACGKCRSCRQAAGGNQPDIIRVMHEKPNTIGVGDIRTQVNDDIMIRPYSSKYKIYIIADADMMSVEAQNALLKTIEEPPEYAVIMLLTENAETLLPTIRSRCVMMKLRNIKDQLVKKYLMEQLEVPDYKADVCVAFAQGNMGKAIMLANSEYFNEIKEEVVHLLRNIDEMTVPDLMEAVKRCMIYKMEISDYLDMIAIWYRDVLIYKATRSVDRGVFCVKMKYIRERAKKSSYEGIENILDSLEKAKAVSMTLPLQEEAYTSPVLFPFFDGLIPEGWLLDVALRNTDISILDRMALLLTCCKDCIGAVSVIPLEEKEGSHV